MARRGVPPCVYVKIIVDASRSYLPNKSAMVNAYLKALPEGPIDPDSLPHLWEAIKMLIRLHEKRIDRYEAADGYSDLIKDALNPPKANGKKNGNGKNGKHYKK